MTAQQEGLRLSMSQHPLSAAFPAMPENEIAALALDIETHGQREPGITLDGMVLDGWHRYLACHRLGIQFRAREFDGADPVAFVISHNLHRRHLTASQRAAAVVSASNWKPVGRPSENRAPGAQLSTKQLAEQAEVSERTIKDAKAAETAGLGDKVRDGEVSAKRAAQVAKLPEAKREKALNEPATPKPPKEKGDVGKLNAELAAEREAHAETREKLHELGDVARELEDKLSMFEATEPDDQQKLVADLQAKLRVKDAEIYRQRGQISDLNNKCNALIKQVKIERKKNG